jgi:hypothetical protein
MSRPTSVVSTPAGAVDLLAQPRYTQSTYQGRVANFFSVIDPRTLLASDSEVKAAVALIENYKKGQRNGVTQEQIWNAKKLRVSAASSSVLCEPHAVRVSC